MTPLLNRRRPDDVVFAALSTEPRRAILRALEERGPMTRAAVEELLGVPRGMSREAAGRHLNQLRAAGLVVRFGGGTTLVRYRRDNASLARALRRIYMSGARLEGIVESARADPSATVAPQNATDAL